MRYIMDNTDTSDGACGWICHCYVDEEFDPAMAVKIVVDSKTQYVAVCNAVETLLVHAEAAESYLPVLKKAMDLNKANGWLFPTQQIFPCLGR